MSQKLRLESLEVETFEPIDTSPAAKAYETTGCVGESADCSWVTFNEMIECMGRTIGGNWAGACP